MVHPSPTEGVAEQTIGQAMQMTPEQIEDHKRGIDQMTGEAL
jgi:hypothetical protein